jgi:hypothetical protein
MDCQGIEERLQLASLSNHNRPELGADAPTSMSQNQNSTATQRGAAQDWRAVVEKFVGSVRFGVVEIVIHEGRVTQIEKTERVRLAPGETKKQPE